MKSYVYPYVLSVRSVKGFQFNLVPEVVCAEVYRAPDEYQM